VPYARITILRGYTIMKKTLLPSVAVLFLATGTAYSTGPDDCTVVVQTRDGFLNVREAPTMKSKIIAKLHPMDMVWADAYECITEECDCAHGCRARSCHRRWHNEAVRCSG
jgi:hypothetical protein